MLSDLLRALIRKYHDKPGEPRPLRHSYYKISSEIEQSYDLTLAVEFFAFLKSGIEIPELVDKSRQELMDLVGTKITEWIKKSMTTPVVYVPVRWTQTCDFLYVPKRFAVKSVGTDTIQLLQHADVETKFCYDSPEACLVRCRQLFMIFTARPATDYPNI